MKINLRKLLIYKKIWITFFLIKVFYMFFALFIYSKFTQLGDTDSYLNGYRFSVENMLISSTSMTGTIGSILSSIFGYIGANFIFMCLSFYGIYYSVNKLKLSHKELVVILLLLSFPSFGIWSSIAGKEAVAVFFMGILAGYIIDFYEKQRKIKLIEVLSFYLGFIFKPHFILPIILCLFFIKLKLLFKLTAIKQLILLFLILLIIIITIWFFRIEFNELSLVLSKHFSQEGTATRLFSFWQKDYDYIYKLPDGILLSFIGPTLEEALSRVVILPIYIESILILIILSFIAIKSSFLKLYYLRVNIFKLSIFILLVFGILIFSYPLGVSNYGAAIRYREGYYAFLVVIIFYLFISRNEKLKGDR